MTDDTDCIFYLIIWTKDRELTVVEAQYHDKRDYRLASETEYRTENEAYLMAQILGLKYDVHVDKSKWFPVLT